jgi:TrmH family RNA methyltransferase
MITKEISSLQHPIVKALVELRKERSVRYEEQHVLIYGNKLVSEIGEHASIDMLIIADNHPIPRHLDPRELVIVSKEIMKKITGVQSPEPIAAVVPMPEPADLSSKRFVLALDGISDPGNLGTLLRTSLALGWEGVFITTDSTDPFNDKALRAAKGATFRQSLALGTREELANLIHKSGFHAYVADLRGTSPKELRVQTPLLLILGSESHGVSAEMKKRYPAISIPMSGQMESLNVASAGAILMYGLKNE